MSPPRILLTLLLAILTASPCPAQESAGMDWEHARAELENKRVRVVRLAVPAHENVLLKGLRVESVVVSVRQASLKVIPEKGTPERWEATPGSAIWMRGGVGHSLAQACFLGPALQPEAAAIHRPGFAVSLLVLALLLAAGSALGIFLANRRKQALERFALYSGFSFEAEWLPEFDEDGQPVITKSSLPELAGTTDGGDWTNVLRGRVAGFDTVVFDYRLNYSRYTATQTVAAFMLSEKVLPKFVIRHEEWTNKLLHMDGLSYTSTSRTLEQQGFRSFQRLRDKESKGWQIFAENKTELQHFLTEPMMDLFDQLLEDPGCIESDGHWLLLYVMCTLVPIRKMGIFLDETSQIAARVYQAALGARPD